MLGFVNLVSLPSCARLGLARNLGSSHVQVLWGAPRSRYPWPWPRRSPQWRFAIGVIISPVVAAVSAGTADHLGHGD